MNEATILKQALGAILDQDPFIYPTSSVGKYETRTDYMNGWNAGVSESVRLIGAILDDLGVDVHDGDNCIDTPVILYAL